MKKTGKNSTNGIENALEAWVNASVARHIQQMQWIDLMPGEKAPTQAEDNLLQAIQTILSESAAAYGIRVSSFGIKGVAFLPEIEKLFYEKMQSSLKQEASRVQSTGMAEAATVRAQADKEYTAVLEIAHQEAAKTKGEGEAIAAQTYANDFKQSPLFAKFYYKLQAYKNAFNQKTDLVVLESEEASSKKGPLLLNKPAP
jgi:membrane protease subunit HflC